MTDRRGDYEEKCDAELSQWSVQLVILKAKAERAEADLKAASHKALGILQINQEKMKVKQLELKAAGNGQWEYLKETMEKDRMNLRISFCGVAAKLG